MQGVLLLNAEPRRKFLSLLRNLETILALVGLHGSLVMCVGLAQHQHVVPTSEGVRVDLDRVEISVGVFTYCLSAGTAVVIPHRHVLNLRGFAIQGLGFRPQSLPSSINPDIGSLNAGSLGELHVLGQHILASVSKQLHYSLVEVNQAIISL